MNIDVLHNKRSGTLVCLFSDPNFLSLNILENLLAEGCTVNIITDNEKLWKIKTLNLSNDSKYLITSIAKYHLISNFSYAIFCGGFIKRNQAISYFKKFIANKNFGNSKSLAIFPFEISPFKSASKISLSDNAGIVYVGDLFGPRIDLGSDLLLPRLMNEMIQKRSLTLGVGEVFFPVFVPDVSRLITKWLLSFGPYGKSIYLLGSQTSSTEFWKQNIKAFPDLKILYDTDIETRHIPRVDQTKRMNGSLSFLLNETYKWLIYENSPSKVGKLKSVKQAKTKIRKPSKFKFLRPFLLPIFLILFFPLITFLISASLLFVSYKQFLSEKITNSQNSAYLAKTVFVVGKAESDVLKYIPLLGLLYKETSYIGDLGATIADTVANVAPAVQTSKVILNNVLGSGIYDIETPSFQIKSSLEYAYQQISLLKIRTDLSASKNVLSAKQILNSIDFDKLTNLNAQGVALAGSLPSILGSDVNKNYLVLFENNMELRPTGGFIGSYGIANFGGGKLNGLTINDIYSADGQLKGHIEPPPPIKTYLGEANWFFRDSNWNPDFPTSAARAEWFLNKEMSTQVDGVMAIDLEPIKNLLTYIGPIFLPDYNLTITSDNLYEKTQQEAQANFFPGSRKKASFLTALSRVLLSEVSKMNSKSRIAVLKVLYESLEGRHIQVTVHDKNPELALSKLGWDGKFPSYSCGADCYSDFFADIEANVGVNKANYFVTRRINFKTLLDSNKITRTAQIKLKNSANISLGPSGIYKTYLRIAIPTDAEVLRVRTVNGQNQEILSPDVVTENGRKEAGVFVSLNPGETKIVEFIWTTEIPNDAKISNYGLYIRKQAGVANDPITLEVATVSKNLKTQPEFTLTKEGIYTYNTTLSRDLFARMSWKK